ncbi:hypothetical protein SMF913_10986 [Streptomyces malaysiensis]|uniref:DUF4142 domain-containing protein n=1 Tax=Streptomyces malaysiensis TaxID=92644 RepID=A0A2J7Z3V6_STRMQ|nr:hypothetical protein SMF913_10986 [Streptomyces malaysiensis]
MVVTLGVIMSPVLTGVQQENQANLAKTSSTQYGPLTGADRDFVVKVRLAGLWEFPVGELALKKGTTAPVKTAGEHLVVGHAQLDAAARDIAPKLGVTLPNKPTPQQQGFLDTLTAATGKDFDSQMAQILRITHGQIFSSIAKIRATSKNTLVRQLATQANTVVLDHITQMENTGMVDYEALPGQITSTPTQGPNFTKPVLPRPGEPMVVLKAPPSLAGKGEAPTPSPPARVDDTPGASGSPATPGATSSPSAP